MAWVRFTRDYDWTPPARPMVTVAYKAGDAPQSVTRDCAANAVRLGRAVRVPAPKRGEANGVRVGGAG